MDGDQDLVTFAVNAHRVVVVVELVGCRCELDVDILSDTCRKHALFVIANFEIGGLWRQNVEPLRRWRIVKNSQFHCVRLVHFKARKLDDAWQRCEKAISAYRVVLVLL